MELDILTGLADIEKQLASGNANQQQLCERLGQILSAITQQKPPAAPVVNVAPEVKVPPAPAFDWYHTFKYDGLGRIVEARSIRTMKGA